MKLKRVILWFRQDLRLHDNEALLEAIKNSDEIIPIYIFDERVFQSKTTFGFAKTGKFRAQFILESVADLRQSLRKAGSELYVRMGKPEDILFKLAKEARTTYVYCNRERTAEELFVQDRLEQNLWSIGQELRYTRGKMLYYTADLPFPVTHTPDIFTQFRKETERVTPIRQPLSAPTSIVPLTLRLEAGEIPTLTAFGHADFEADTRSMPAFKGGETEGLKRLHYYFWESNLVKSYEETRNGLIGNDYSSKFSAWLAQGCISPKTIYWELKRYESERGENKSTYWLFFELLWRDFFRLMGKKFENKIFQKGGTLGKPDKRWTNDERILQLWMEGKTGIPFIDANMRELAATGFMSNRGRQNVASFLIKDLHVNWVMGAEWFESMLLDYDPCSNYGNWNYIAGVGNDPRENRYFNILNQALRYDSKGEYVKLWLPELKNIPIEKIHRLDTLTAEELKLAEVKMGVHYPKTMVGTAKWV
jgi:deoxyribodipyrimidine photo-lyase